MIVITRTCIVLGLLIVFGSFVTARGQDDTLPERTTFTLPPQLEGLAKGLEEAGINYRLWPELRPGSRRNKRRG